MSARVGPVGLFDPAGDFHDSQITARDEAAYRKLLHQAVVAPELLSDIDRAQLLPEDTDLIVSALDREIAGIDARLHNLEVRSGRVSGKRRRELVRLAKENKFRYSEISIDELRAIDATPGLWAEIIDAQDAAEGLA
jgi:hypothetical protein